MNKQQVLLTREQVKNIFGWGYAVGIKDANNKTKTKGLSEKELMQRFFPKRVFPYD
jgi:hypothetical protein